jgi:hypothetical protein
MSKENIVYEITGDDGKSYYTFKLPVFMDDKIVCNTLIGKGVVSEDIVSKKIEEYYRVELTATKEGDPGTFPLSKGVSIKLLDSTILAWLNKTEKEAQDALKDKLLQYYQSALPVLLQNVEVLKKELFSLQQQNSEIDYSERTRTGGKKNNLLI